MPQIIRTEKKDNFTEMNSYLLKDKEISFSAKGMLAYMLHNKKDWKYYISQLSNASTDGKTKVISILEELEEKKYLIRKKFRDEKGRFKYKFMVFDMPFDYFEKTLSSLKDKWLDEDGAITVVSTNSLKFENQFIKNEKLSFKAKGIMLFLLTLEEDKTISRKLLEENSTDRKNSLLAGMKELIALEYVEKIGKQSNNNDKKGFGSFDYAINEKRKNEDEIFMQNEIFKIKKIKPSKELLEFIKNKKISNEQLLLQISKIPNNVEHKSAYLLKILQKIYLKKYSAVEVMREVNRFKEDEKVKAFEQLDIKNQNLLKEKFKENTFNINWYIVNFETMDSENPLFGKGF